MIETLENVDLPIKNPECMNDSETNFPPLFWNIGFYSKALMRALVGKGLLSGPRLRHDLNLLVVFPQPSQPSLLRHP
jgi:hypothetical protein